MTRSERIITIADEIVRRIDTVARCTPHEVDGLYERALAGEFDDLFTTKMATALSGAATATEADSTRSASTSNLPPEAAALGEVTKEQEASSSNEVEQVRRDLVAELFRIQKTANELRAERDQLAGEVEAQKAIIEQLSVSRDWWEADRNELAEKLSEQAARWDKLREPLQRIKAQLAVGRRYLPSHGTFGEEGIDNYGWAQREVDELLDLIDSLSKEGEAK